MNPPVPASTAVRTRSVDHVETDRLLARLDWLRDFARNVGAHDVTKNDLADRAREAVNVERALARRGVPFRPVTDGAHLAVDVHAVPKLNPVTSRKRWLADNGHRAA